MKPKSSTGRLAVGKKVSEPIGFFHAFSHRLLLPPIKDANLNTNKSKLNASFRFLMAWNFTIFIYLRLLQCLQVELVQPMKQYFSNGKLKKKICAHVKLVYKPVALSCSLLQFSIYCIIIKSRLFRTSYQQQSKSMYINFFLR